MDGASHASTVPMSIPPASGSGRGESGDGYGSDLLGGNYLRERAIQGSASMPGLIGAPSSAQRAREHIDAGFREIGEAKAARDQIRSALEARERELSALEACEREAAERASVQRSALAAREREETARRTREEAQREAQRNALEREVQ